MSCDRCLDLCVKYVIRQPEQLPKAICIAKNALSEGVLAETDHGSGGYWSPENEKPSEIID